MNYHNIIWLCVGLGYVVGLFALGILIYTYFFED